MALSKGSKIEAFQLQRYGSENANLGGPGKRGRRSTESIWRPTVEDNSGAQPGGQLPWPTPEVGSVGQLGGQLMLEIYYWKLSANCDFLARI